MKRWMRALCLCLLLATVAGCTDKQPEAVDYKTLTNQSFAALDEEQKKTYAGQFLAALSVQARYPEDSWVMVVQQTLDAAPGKTMGQMVQEATSIGATP